MTIELKGEECMGFNDPYQSTFTFPSEPLAHDTFSNKCNELRYTHHELKIDYENAEALSFNQPNSELHQSVIKFLQQILNSLMKLGIPNAQELIGAREVLREIGEIINSRPLGEPTIVEAIIIKSNEFYQMIPHDGPGYFSDIQKGFRPPIGEINQWRAKNEIVSRLQIVLGAISQGIEADGINPLDYFSENFLHTQITPIVEGSPEYQLLMSDFNVHFDDTSQCKNIFNVDKNTWNEEFRKDIDNQHYLFHVAHMRNMVDILRDGLEVAPGHVVSYNRWLGRGIYFFGNLKAALAYARRVKRNVVLICRVALGESDIVEDRFDATNSLDLPRQLGDGKSSIKSPGKRYESLFEWNEEKKAFLPSGINDNSNWTSHFIEHDEILVQYKNQVKIEYIIELTSEF